MSDNISYCWQGKNLNILAPFTDRDTIAKKLFALSMQDKYRQTELMYFNFLQQSFENSSKDVFSAIFLWIEENNLFGFLTANVSFEQAEIDFIFVDELSTNSINKLCV